MKKNKKDFKKLLNQKAKIEDNKLALLKDFLISTNKNLNRINSKLEALIALLQRYNAIYKKDLEYRYKYKKPILEKVKKIIKKFSDKKL